jgi:hypothetical protein
MTETCACGCAVAAWSMPWPATPGGAAHWTPTPAPVHQEVPGRAPGALFPVELAEEMAQETTAADIHDTERDT